MPYRSDRLALAAPALDAIAARRVRDGRAPASSWALFGPRGVVATGAAGDPAPGPEIAFRMASCTKSVTAALLLVLRDEGRLDLDARVDEVLDVRVAGASRPPTLRELATHTGGIPVDDPWADRQESVPAERLDALLAGGVRLVREPGTRYEYSSLGFAILGRVIERAANRPYVETARDRLFTPLGLGEIGFNRSIGPVVDGFARVDDRWAVQPWAEPGAFSPLGGLVATPRALAAWAGWLASAWRDDASDRVLAAASRREMQQPHATVPGGQAYGFGLVVEQHPRHGRVVSHSGGYPGFGANMRWHAPSGIGVIVAENARYSGATAPAAEALALVLDAAAVPDAEPHLWPETARARELVERLVRGAAWRAGDFADNVPLDETLEARRAAAAGLRQRIGLDPGAPVLPLAEAAPRSDSAAHLAWSIPGTAGSVRAVVRLTPEPAPRIQTLDLRLG